MITRVPKEGEIQRQWYLIDVENKVLGRVATKIAVMLRGKHKPFYSPHLDVGDFIVVVNAKHVVLTGRKDKDKKYYRHSGYPGGLKVQTAGEIREKRPEDLIRKAVWGMLPKNKLRKQLMRKLKVYPGAEHPHEAQQPTVLTF